jgi:hypothetical protein
VRFPTCVGISYKYEGFPHSEIFGSKVARHLPEAYRRHATSFVAISSQGIHHTLLNFPLGNLKTTFLISSCLTRLNLLRHFLFHFQQTKTPFASSAKKRCQSGIKLSKFVHMFRKKKPVFSRSGLITSQGVFTLSFASWLNILKTYVLSVYTPTKSCQC